MSSANENNQQRLADAAERVTVAEAEFAAATDEMRASDRSDTQMVTHRLRKAMPELAAARTDLAELVGTPTK